MRHQIRPTPCEARRRRRRWLLPLALVSLAGSRAGAQAVSVGAGVPVTATKPGRLTVTPTANATQGTTGVVDGGLTMFGPGPVAITTWWDVKPGRTTSIQLVGYFLSPTAALVDGTGDAIPTSEIEARMSTVAGMTWTPFTGAPVTAGTATVGSAGGSLLFWTVPISGANKAATRDDEFSLRLNLTARQGGLPAGDYRGTLYLRAIAF